jgi:hypothetical protein
VDASTVEIVIRSDYLLDGEPVPVIVENVTVVRSDGTETSESDDGFGAGEDIELEHGESFVTPVNAGVGPDNIERIRIHYWSYEGGVLGQSDSSETAGIRFGNPPQDVCMEEL